MVQMFRQMLQAQETQTVDMVGGLQCQYQEAMKGMMVGMVGAGNRGTGQENLKGITKPTLHKGEPNICTQSGRRNYLHFCGRWPVGVPISWSFGPVSDPPQSSKTIWTLTLETTQEFYRNFPSHSTRPVGVLHVGLPSLWSTTAQEATGRSGEGSGEEV